MSDLLTPLKFVRGAIKKNNVSPELEHYQIGDGQIVGFNGYMAIGAPIDLPVVANPRADLFFKALEACGDENITLAMGEDGRLRIRAGKFSALIPCVTQDLYKARPQGEKFSCPKGYAAACKSLHKLISDDATRPWAMGMLHDAGSLYVTNNVIILQQWVGFDSPTFTIPRFAVAEVARIGIDPIEVQVSKGTVTFHYSDGRWLRTQQLESQWPLETVNRILGEAGTGSPLPERIFDGIRTITPFSTDMTTAIKFDATGVYAGAEDTGAGIELSGMPTNAPAFSGPMFLLLEGLAKTMDFSAYPNPCGFAGDNRRGVILGLRRK